VSTPRLLDLTLPAPEENLALDEALLLAAERSGGEWLRFWESPRHFVVLGVAARLERDADAGACRRDGIPILRRGSGGGTVLQGPGCLNFALVLSLAARPELRPLHGSYAAILETTARALEAAGARHEGTSDIALGGLKFSGNAQKRTRSALLHHGTVLHDFDLGLVERYLREPEKQPHARFLANLSLPSAEIRRRLAAAWGAVARDPGEPLPPIQDLLHQKYGNRAWIERF
jgi:lipoate-protein ligase A